MNSDFRKDIDDKISEKIARNIKYGNDTLKKYKASSAKHRVFTSQKKIYLEVELSAVVAKDEINLFAYQLFAGTPEIGKVGVGSVETPQNVPKVRVTIPPTSQPDQILSPR